MSADNFFIDTSIIAAYLLDDEKNVIADVVIESLSRYEAIAPSFLSLEMSNVFLLAERRRRITSERRLQLIESVREFEITEEIYSQERVFSRVLPLAVHHGLTAYDAAYLELAVRCSIPLATLDQKLRSAAIAQGVAVFNGDNL